jgi:hypothetical protein
MGVYEHMEGKYCISIISCNPTYLGLSVGGWAINFVFVAMYVSLVPLFCSSFTPVYFCLGIQVLCDIIYIKVLLKLEENIGEVLLTNLSIPSFIYGFSVRLPKKPVLIAEAVKTEIAENVSEGNVAGD